MMQARWYSPQSGTFRSRDTWAGDLNTPVTLNRYTYANNNPIRYWDPSGRIGCSTGSDLCFNGTGQRVVTSEGELVTPGTADTFSTNHVSGGLCAGQSGCRRIAAKTLGLVDSETVVLTASGSTGQSLSEDFLVLLDGRGLHEYVRVRGTDALELWGDFSRTDGIDWARPCGVNLECREFINGYEEIVHLPIDHFLALRAHLHDNPSLLEQSPYDWYADGCSIPFNAYPGSLDGSCLRHDFSYTNARFAADEFELPAFIDVERSYIAESLKQRPDEHLRRDIRSGYGQSPTQVLPPQWWAGTVYFGVAVDFGWFLPSGKKAFEAEYTTDRGENFDPTYGAWSAESVNSYYMQSLIEIALGSGS